MYVCSLILPFAQVSFSIEILSHEQRIQKHVVAFALDKYGSVWLESRLNLLAEKQRDAFQGSHRWIWGEVQGNLLKICLDSYGNYVSTFFVAVIVGNWSLAR